VCPIQDELLLGFFGLLVVFISSLCICNRVMGLLKNEQLFCKSQLRNFAHFKVHNKSMFVSLLMSKNCTNQFFQNLKSYVDTNLDYLPGSVPMAYTDDETCKDFWTSAIQPSDFCILGA